MFTNASTFEGAWSSLAAFGFVFFVLLWFLGRRDQDYLADPVATLKERRALGSRRIIAAQNITIILLLAACEGALLVGGVIAMVVPSPQRAMTTTGAILIVSLFAAHCCIAGTGLVLFVARIKLMAKIRAERETLAAHDMGEDTSRDENSSALRANTEATNAATNALYNGPLKAQIAQTEATTELTTVTAENTEVIKISTEVEMKKLDEGKSDG